jgi:hypothetical protein
MLHSHYSEIYFALEQKGKWQLHHTISNKELEVGVQRGKARHQPITSLQNQTTVRVLCRLDELLMFKTFARQYIDNKDFNRWWYATSGLPGHVPCNNPHESHNYQVKGGFEFKGFMQGARP